MFAEPLCLTGTIQQADAEGLRHQCLGQLAGGGLAIRAEALNDITLGPMQVLLCAAVEARKRGLPCRLQADAAVVFDRCLAAVRLPESSTYFSLVPHTEMQVAP